MRNQLKGRFVRYDFEYHQKKISRYKNKVAIVELKRLQKVLIKMLEDLGETYIDID